MEKAGLELNIQKTKIVASSPITSWQIDGETMETVTDFFRPIQMVTGVMKLKDLCSLENIHDHPRQQIKKQRHYFANKIHLVKAMVFPIVMYGYQSWTIKKPGH